MKKLLRAFKAIADRSLLAAHCGSIGVGLIGVGGWGATNSLNIMRSRRFDIVGACDTQSEVALRFARQFGTKHYDKVEDLVRDASVRAVAITVPNHFHAELITIAADAGKHIFIEKPLASSPDLCLKIDKYCRERNVVLLVGHQVRRDPAFRTIKHILDTGLLGRPLFVHGACTLDGQRRNDWRRDTLACPCGSMEQLGVHLIDVLLYLFGKPKSTTGWCRNIPHGSLMLDWGCISVSFEAGVRATISTSFSSPQCLRLELYFEGGRITTDGQTMWISQGLAGSRKVKPKGISGGVAQFVEFADCIERGVQPETGGKEATAVMEVVSSILLGKEE